MPSVYLSAMWLTIGLHFVLAHRHVAFRTDARSLTTAMQQDINRHSGDIVDVNRSQASVNTCPMMLVKRCRYCPYDGGKCNCFKVETTKGWQGTLCKSAWTTKRCTGEGVFHKPPKCSLTADTHDPLLKRLTELSSFADAAQEMWDVIYMKYNLCHELEVKNGNFSRLEHVGSMSSSRHLGVFEKLRKQDVMHNGKTVQEQLKESLLCDSRFSEDFKPEDHQIIIHSEKRAALHSVFEGILTPIKATGNSGARAMKFADGLFRVKEVEASEKAFWEKHVYNANFTNAKAWMNGTKRRRVGSILMDHWLNEPKSSFAKLYAMVNVRASNEDPFYFSVMRNVFAGIPDFKNDPAARIYDIKGSGRKCKGKQSNKTMKPELCGKKGEELKEQDFDDRFKDGLALPAWGERNAFQEFFQSLFADIAILKYLKVHDYSIVMRITTNAPSCPSQQLKAVQAIEKWESAPKWQGAAIEMCAMVPMGTSNGSPVRISAVLLDFLQDATTVHNTLASAAPGSKIASGKYAIRLAEYLVRTFRPFMMTGKRSSMYADKQSASDLYGSDLTFQEAPDPKWLKFDMM